MSQSNNIFIPISILFAGAMVAIAVIFVGTSNGNQALTAQPGQPGAPAAGPQGGGDRSQWANAAIHRAYAEELGLDADALVSCFEAGTHAERVAGSTQEGAANGGSGTPYFVINGIPLSGAQPFQVFAEVIELALAGETGDASVSVDESGWPTLGIDSAPVTIVEYSDYACPFCKRFATQTKPQIVEEYIESGQVRFVRKDFIAVGGNKAAEAAHCAGDQGAYWEYHDLLMARQ